MINHCYFIVCVTKRGYASETETFKAADGWLRGMKLDRQKL